MNNIMMAQLMNTLKSMIPVVEPDNEVADFVATEIEKISGGAEELELISYILIGIANENPEKVLNRLYSLYNDIGCLHEQLEADIEDDLDEDDIEDEI